MTTCEAAKTTGGRIAVVGMFDGVHLGHRYLLGELRHQGAQRSLVPMAYTFTNHPLELVAPARAPRLLSTADEKERLLRAEDVEPVAVPFDEDMRLTSAADFLWRLADEYRVRCLMLGFNNRFGHDAPDSIEGYQALGRDAGVEIIVAPEFTMREGAVSSSEIRRALQEGRAEDAAAMLGRPYSLTGEVVHGKALGRTLGFPTANIVAPPAKLIPGRGVYAARAVTASGDRYPAMVNIGHRPTVDAPEAPDTIEAHLIGADTDLYGQPLRLEFTRYLRPEQRFSSPAALARQLEEDRKAAML